MATNAAGPASGTSTATPVFTFATEGLEDILLQNLAITPATAIAIFLAFCLWYGIMFFAIVSFIIKRTNWSLEMDFALHGRQLKAKTNKFSDSQKGADTVASDSQRQSLYPQSKFSVFTFKEDKDESTLAERSNKKKSETPVVLNIENDTNEKT